VMHAGVHIAPRMFAILRGVLAGGLD